MPAPPSSAWVALVGLLGFGICICLGLFLTPLPNEGYDTYHFQHWIKTDFTYASSPIDLSVLSPFQGLAGLAQPIAVWINPAYILPHLMPFGEPRVWSCLVVTLLMMLATYFLGRTNGLPHPLAVIGAQLITLFSFWPFCDWSISFTHYTGSQLYAHIEGIAVPAILGTLLLAVFCCLGKLSRVKNSLCVVLLPAIIVYSILCDPLYTAIMFVPIALFLGGVFLGSENRSVLLWRVLGGIVCLAVCLALNLHGFYHALTGYAARAVFPNELYVEVQQWDSNAGFFFQGGITTCAIALMITSALYVVAFGTSQMRGFAASILFYQWLMIVGSVVYVYSGIRWSQPLPVYLEIGAQPAYMVAGLLGLHLLRQRFLSASQTGKLQNLQSLTRRLLGPNTAYFYVLLIPLIGSIWVLNRDGMEWGSSKSYKRPTEAVGIVKFLADRAALGTNGQFRGSVAMVIGVPGGGIMNRFGMSESDPYSKQQINYIEGYGNTYAPDFNITGLWNQRIPTLEDNNHLVTPPFHFLVSHALSRPQDFHSRNWAPITKSDPKLMAALGTRYIVSDKILTDPLLTLLTQTANADGVILYIYEIQNANLGNLSPIQTIVSTNALQTLSLMTSKSVNLNDVAIVHQAALTGLTRADAGAIYYEKGGVRVRAKSHGPCLLVLPVQFSNSLRITSREGGADTAPVQLLRVNLLETGVLFDGEINVKIAHVFGPLRGVKGRLRDIEDCRRLGIKETGDIPYPPDYQPLGRKKLETPAS